MKEQDSFKKAMFAAFPLTVPILAGFLFLGAAYGIYMNAAGFSPVYPVLMSMTIFAGSVEFLAVSLLLGGFDPAGVLLLTLMVNARHLFYGISMLERYAGVGRKKWYLIFGMCDESFSINCTARVPDGVDKGQFYLCVTLLNHLYWVLGATLGGVFGALVSFQTKGLEFVMTALFVVIFLEQWHKERDHSSALIGLGVSLLCLTALGGASFIIPAMLLIITSLTLLRPVLERRGAAL